VKPVELREDKAPPPTLMIPRLTILWGITGSHRDFCEG